MKAPARTELTRRDALALGWIGEQYGARVDTLAVLLGRLSPVDGYPGGPLSRRGVRNQLARWDRAGLARTGSRLGSAWAIPTEAGLRYGGLSYAPWAAPGARLEHAHAVAVVRLWAEAQGASWTGERELRRQRTEDRKDGRDFGRWHCPDGVVDDQDGKRLLVEVELSQHNDRKVHDALSRPAPRAAGGVYFTRPDMVELVRAQLARVWPNLPYGVRQLRDNWSVRPLPDVPGTTYDGGW